MTEKISGPMSCLSSQASRCIIEVVPNCFQDPAFIDAWHAMAAASSGPEVVFQTPQYFRLMGRVAGDHRAELLAVRDARDGQLLSIVPLRVWQLPIKFSIGSRQLAQRRLPVVSLLGSGLLGDPPAEVVEQVLKFLFDRYEHCAGVSMQALPQQSALWNTISVSPELRRLCRFWPMYSWRDCHTVPLPGSFEQYLARMSTKKRYNLGRQVRLLEKEAGELQLHPIRQAEQVPLLVQALRALAPDEPAVWEPQRWVELAEHELLQAFVLTAGGQPVGAILGMQAQRTLHLHRILFDAGLARLSVGTSLTYLVVKALCEQGKCNLIDMGYGTPAHVQQSTNVTQQRAHMVMLRKTWANHVLANAHDALESLVGRVKARLAAHHARGKAQQAAQAQTQQPLAPKAAPVASTETTAGGVEASITGSMPTCSSAPGASDPPSSKRGCPGPAHAAPLAAATKSQTSPKCRSPVIADT